MAGEAHGNLAANAAAYLARSADPAICFGGEPKEIDRQAACLVEWARANDVILADDYTSGLERHVGVTAEHEVFVRIGDNRAVKRTYPGTFGITDDPEGKQHHATPMFYLRRLELMNRVFGADLRLEGVSFGKTLLIGPRRTAKPDNLPTLDTGSQSKATTPDYCGNSRIHGVYGICTVERGILRMASGE